MFNAKIYLLINYLKENYQFCSSMSTKILRIGQIYYSEELAIEC